MKKNDVLTFKGIGSRSGEGEPELVVRDALRSVGIVADVTETPSLGTGGSSSADGGLGTELTRIGVTSIFNTLPSSQDEVCRADTIVVHAEGPISTEKGIRPVVTRLAGKTED